MFVPRFIRNYFCNSLGTHLGFTMLKPCKFFGLDIWSYGQQLDENKLETDQATQLYYSDTHRLPLKSENVNQINKNKNFVTLRFWFILAYMVFNGFRYFIYIIVTVENIPITDHYLDTFRYFAPFPMYLNVASSMSSFIIMRTMFALYGTIKQPLNPKAWWIYIFIHLDNHSKTMIGKSHLCLPLQGIELKNFRIVAVVAYSILIVSIFFYDVLASLNSLDIILRHHSQTFFYPYILTGLIIFHSWFTLAFRIQLYLIMLFLFLCRYLQLLARQLKKDISENLSTHLKRWPFNIHTIENNILMFAKKFLIFNLHLERFNAGYWSRFFLYSTGFGTPELLALTYLVLNAKLLPIPYVVCVGLCINFYLVYITLYTYSARVNKMFVINYRILISFAAKLFHRNFIQLTLRQNASLNTFQNLKFQIKLSVKIKVINFFCLL